MPTRSNPAVVAACLFVLAQSQSADAAGLGKAKVLSSAGDLLKVRVELILGPGDRPGRIKAAVASPSIPEDDEENQLWVTVDPAPYGRAVLTVRSIAPIEADRIELIVAVSSPAGRAYRDYELDLPKPKHEAGTAGAPASPKAAQAAGGPQEVSPNRTAMDKTLSAPAATPAPASAPPPAAHASAAQEALDELEDEASFGRLTAVVALAIALLAGIGAVWVWLYRRG